MKKNEYERYIYIRFQTQNFDSKSLNDLDHIHENNTL
jgi:hypothetical protein